MKNTYMLNRTWRYILIVSSAGLVFMFLLPVFVGNFSGKASDFIWSALIAGVISGGLTYGVVTSKIITSSEGIETSSFGIKIKAMWNKVERLDINSYGFVNLFFKESIYKDQFVNTLLRPLAYDRTIQLSPYINDLATSNLLKDIRKYVPNSNIPEFVAELKLKRSVETYQKVGVIGLYYLGWFIMLVVLAFVFRKGAEYLDATGFSNMTLVSYIISISLAVGLFFKGMGLFGYNAEIADLDEIEISHKARTYYISPVVAMAIGFLVGICLWILLKAHSIILSDNDFGVFGIVALFAGLVLLRASNKIERILFRNKFG